MATTSLWRVKGHISAVVRYAENKDKTTEQKKPDGEGESFAPDSEESLNQVLDYASRDDATAGWYVTPINCSAKHAAEDMQAIKRVFGKEGGTIAYHGYQSFRGGEVTPDIAHEIGVKLARELWGDRYQVLVATHLDKQSHLHNHFVLNTVSFVDGKKFCRTNADYQAMRDLSDRLCREYGLSVIRDGQGKGKTYAEWKADRDGDLTMRELIRRDIDDAIKAAFFEREIYEYLEDMGYSFRFYSKSYAPLVHPTLRPKGAERNFRFDRLGPGYDLEEIHDRLICKYTRQEPTAVKKRREFEARLKNPLPPEYFKMSGWAQLLFCVLYVLGLIKEFPEAQPEKAKTYRKDISRMPRYMAQQNFLAGKKIRSIEDLDAWERGIKYDLNAYKRQYAHYTAVLNDLDPQHELDLDRPDHPRPPEYSRALCNAFINQERIRHCKDSLRVIKTIREDIAEIQRKAKDLGVYIKPNGDYGIKQDLGKPKENTDSREENGSRKKESKIRDDGAR